MKSQRRWQGENKRRSRLSVPPGNETSFSVSLKEKAMAIILLLPDFLMQWKKKKKSYHPESHMQTIFLPGLICCFCSSLVFWLFLPLLFASLLLCTACLLIISNQMESLLIQKAACIFLTLPVGDQSPCLLNWQDNSQAFGFLNSH